MKKSQEGTVAAPIITLGGFPVWDESHHPDSNVLTNLGKHSHIKVISEASFLQTTKDMTSNLETFF